MFGVYNIDIDDDKCNYEVTSYPVNVNLCKSKFYMLPVSKRS